MANLHEDYARGDSAKMGSEWGLALVFAGVCLVVLTIVYLRSGELWWWLAVLAIVLLLLGRWTPALLRPINRLWHGLGLWLGKLVSPLIMGLIFFLIVTPTGLIRRALGHDSLRQRFEADAGSYWIVRDPPGPDPRDLPRQF